MPSSPLLLRSCTTLVSALLVSVSSANSNRYYAIDTTYQGPTFFDGFSFFSAADPTHGFVDYLSRGDALGANVISYGSAQPAIMKVDASTPLIPPTDHQYYNQDGVGRKSVRIESVKTWTHGLIILDIDHMPTSATDGCGTWPAFWTLGSGTWPQNGELDIIEGANDQVKNFAVAHTGSADRSRECTVANNGGSGDLIYSNCNLHSPDPWGNPTNPSGCKIEDKTAASYGKPFNDNKGGVYAMEWTSEYIKTYFFPRGSIPTDVGAGTPDPSKWPAPFGVFSTPCDIDSNYNNMHIIFDTTFCGELGDATWSSSCAAKTGFDTCAKYVASKPQDFAEAYWQIESLKVYTLKNAPVTTASSSTTISTHIPSSSITSARVSNPTSSSTTGASRSSTTSVSSSTAYSSTPGLSTSASSTCTTSSYVRSSSGSSTSSLSSATSTDTSTFTKSDSTSSSSAYPSASTWIDWAVDPASATVTTTSSSSGYSVSSGESWSSSASSMPALRTSTTTAPTSDASYTWADWSGSSTASDASTTKPTTEAHEPSTTWREWQAADYAGAFQVGGQYYPVSSPSSHPGSWGLPGAPASTTVGLTTMTVQPTPSVVADVTQVRGGAVGGSASAPASAIGSMPVGYAGSIGTGTSSPNGSGSPVRSAIATYSANGAVRTGESFATVALLAGAMAVVL